MQKKSGGLLISQVKQVQDRVFDALLKEHGMEELSGAQGRILFVLWQEDDIAIVELSRRTLLAKTTLTGMLDHMESGGFLTRRYDRKDRRQIRICLTEKAKSLSNSYQEVSNEMTLRFYQNFEDTEIEAFEGYLQRILQNLL